MPDQTFTAGQILTAAQMSTLQTNIGLTFIKSQTIGNLVNSVPVTDAFSTNFDNYLITITGGVSSVETHITMIVGATTSNYYSAISGNTWSNSASNSGGTTQNSFVYAFSAFGANGINGAVNCFSPFLAKYTMFSSQFMATFGTYQSSGMLQNTTSYTGFTIAPNSGTLSGGTITVYGYRNP